MSPPVKGGRPGSRGLLFSARICRIYPAGSAFGIVTAVPERIRTVPSRQVNSSFGSYPRNVYRPHRDASSRLSRMKQCRLTAFSARRTSTGVLLSERIVRLTGTDRYSFSYRFASASGG